MKMYIKIFICLATLIFINIPISAQDVNRDTLTSLSKGSKALLFEIDQNLYIDSYIGAIISVKKHFTDHSSFRFGLSTTISYSSEENKYIYEDSWTNDASKNEGNSQIFTLSLEYLYYPITNKKLSLFFGGGPSISYNHTFTKQYDLENWNSNDWDEQYKSSRNGCSLGLIGSIGIELFVVNYISLIAEYGFTATYSYTEDKSKNMSNNAYSYEKESKSFRLNSQSKKVGLSFYF
ncbi:outer membrane beta-barrel protein [candidate division KSB1 bacterium]|nr:outer membrane beta-barrel protein [candidate division KSB1 bacterium]